MSRRRKGRKVNGVLVIDKPKGQSSNSIVQNLKRRFNAQKVGHTGTLDPMATGVLPIVFGEATKFSHYGLNSCKTYQARIQLGARTDSLDADGNIVETCSIPPLTHQLTSSKVATLLGTQQQLPPSVSALKQNGQPWYKLVRKGVEIRRTAREITVYQSQLLDFDNHAGWIDIEIHCSKGTYIRSLAETLGSRLGSCAYLSRLKRIKVGELDLKVALTLDLVEKRLALGLDACDSELHPVDYLLSGLPHVDLCEDDCIALIQGKKIPANGLQVCDTSRAYFDGNHFVGLVTVRPDGFVVPKRMISSAAVGMCG